MIDWTQFTRRIPVRAPMHLLYSAWANAEEIEKWFLKKAKYTTEEGEAHERVKDTAAGMKYEWNWYLYDPSESGKVTAANGKDHYQFTFAGDCVVDVRLTQAGEEVVVELSQSNIPTDDKSKESIRLGCDAGWSFFLVNLKSVYEGGLDLRNKNEEMKGMVNA